MTNEPDAPLPDDAPEAAPTVAPAAPVPEVAAEASPADGAAAAGPEARNDLSPAACGAKLAELFPALFVAPGAPGPLKPIKLKVHADIQTRAPGVFSRRALGLFFSRYTTSTAYLKALAQAPHRYDLDGAPAGEIADEHRQAAAAELERRRGIHQARRAAEREAQLQAQRAARRESQGAQRAEDEARRERANLLRAFETSPLAKANFCALKGLTEAALDAALAQARQERAERAERGLPPGRPEGARAPAEHRPDDRRPRGRRPDGPRPPRRTA